MQTPSRSLAAHRSSEDCIDSELVSRAQQVIERLRARQLTVVTAESCTGGLVCAALSVAVGAAEHLHGAFVVYTKEQKSVALGISSEMLARDGSVTSEVARDMVEGALARSKADIAVSITGVLGPEPDEDGNPVGRLFIAYGKRGGSVETIGCRLPPGNHEALRRLAIKRALAGIERAIDIP